MSFISFDKAISAADIYQLNTAQTYCSSDFTVFLVLAGKMRILDQNLATEDLVFLPPGETVSFEPTDEVTVAIVRFDSYLLLSALDGFDLFAKIRTSASMISLKECVHSLEELIRSFHSGLSAGHYFRFIEDIERLFPHHPARSVADASTDTGKEILSYIESHLLKNITLNDAAANVHLTPQYLASFFQKNFKMTFKEYVNSQKVELTLPLLRFTSFSEEALAGLLGYSSALSMNKTLLNITGQTVKEIRANSGLPCKEVLISSKYLVRDFDKYLSASVSEDEQVSSALTGVNLQNLSFSGIPTLESQLSSSWRSIINLGDAHFMINSEFRSQLISLQKEIHFQFGRIKNVLDIMTIHTIGGNIFYGFEDIFKIIDFLLDLDLIPFLVFGNHSSRKSGDSFDLNLIDSSEDFQSYTKKMLRTLPNFIKACCNRYGLKEVSKWYFEFCYDFTNHNSSRPTIWQFLNSYQKYEKILHTYLPDCKVGGPGYNSILPLSEFENMLKNISADHIRFDFFSYSVYENKELSPEAGILPNGSLMVDRSRNTAQLIQNYFQDAVLFITEFSIIYGKRNFLNDSTFFACLLIWFATGDYKQISGIGFAQLSDIASEYADSRGLLFGGPGLFTYQGLRKPSYYAFHFINQMGPVRLNSHPGFIVTSKSKYSYQCLLFHCPGLTREATVSAHNKELLISNDYIFEPIKPKHFFVQLTDMIPGRYLMKEYRLNSEHGNLLKEFAKIRNVTDIGQTDIDCLTLLSTPHAALAEVLVKKDGILHLSLDIKAPEVIMIHIDYNSKEDGHEL
ncbi:MAG: hypothetical protein E7282_02570 [Lachnospiraceae bacterium]|nr:hypothetical protein [Lachnospiraceae bacterium]